MVCRCETIAEVGAGAWCQWGSTPDAKEHGGKRMRCQDYQRAVENPGHPEKSWRPIERLNEASLKVHIPISFFSKYECRFSPLPA